MRYLTSPPTEEDLDGLRVIVVPSGIGEFQWAWTKYINTGERFAILGLDGAPRRLHQFCALHPQIELFYYSKFDYSTIRYWQKFHGLDTWADVALKFPLGTQTMLACNPHLEAGLPLATWLPDLPTSYQYDLRLEQEHLDAAEKAYTGTPTFPLGISCASYRGAEAWKTWNTEQWIKFLRLIHSEHPNVTFCLLGGSWDDLTAAIFDEAEDLPWLVNSRGIPPIGRTSFGTACAILRNLSGYIGFSSGLGHVACHCCSCPTFMLWPEHEQPLSRAWVDPFLFENGFYVPSRWLEPEVVFQQAKPWLRRISDGSY